MGMAIPTDVEEAEKDKREQEGARETARQREKRERTKQRASVRVFVIAIETLGKIYGRMQ